MKERWKPIPNWEFYEVSDRGRVRRAHDHYEIVIFDSPGDRPTVALKWGKREDGKARTLRTYVARLMLLAFVGPPPTPKHETRHLDDIADHNVLSNLCWGTHSENMQDFVRNGLSRTGEKHPLARLTQTEVLAIRKEYKPYKKGRGIKDLAAKYGISVQHTRQIVQRTRWTHI